MQAKIRLIPSPRLPTIPSPQGSYHPHNVGKFLGQFFNEKVKYERRRRDLHVYHDNLDPRLQHRCLQGYLFLSWVVYFSLAPSSFFAYGYFMRKPKPRTTSIWLRSAEVASVLGISHRTLLRKLASGKLPEPARDPANNYRQWRPEEVDSLHQQLLREKS